MEVLSFEGSSRRHFGIVFINITMTYTHKSLAATAGMRLRIVPRI